MELAVSALFRISLWGNTTCFSREVCLPPAVTCSSPCFSDPLQKLAAKLHRTFSWILKTAGTRLYEHQLEGPAMVRFFMRVFGKEPA